MVGKNTVKNTNGTIKNWNMGSRLDKSFILVLIFLNFITVL